METGDIVLDTHSLIIYTQAEVEDAISTDRSPCVLARAQKLAKQALLKCISENVIDASVLKFSFTAIKITLPKREQDTNTCTHK